MALLINEPVGILLTADGEIDRSAKTMQFARGLDGVVQGVRVRMLLVKGEWFLDQSKGVPYLERDLVTASEALLGQRFNETKALAAFRTPILATPGVLSIAKLAVAFTAATRTLAVTWRARTVFGDTPVDTLRTNV